MRIVIGLTTLLLVAGCESRGPEKQMPIFDQQCDYMLEVVVDVSGSYLDILEKKGFPLHDSVADAVQYVIDFPGVAKEKTCVMVLSDMDDNFPDSDKTRARMLKALGDYAKKGGSVGFYFVDQHFVPGLRRDLAGCGFKHPPVVEDAIVVSPQLPRFSE